MSDWFALGGDARLRECSSIGCGGQVTWRFESGGVALEVCSGCKAQIEKMQEREGRKRQDEYFARLVEDVGHEGD